MTDSIFYSSLARVCAVTFRPRTLGKRPLPSLNLYSNICMIGSIWVPSICFELVLFGMLFVKLIRHAQLTAGTGSVPRLIRVLHRDGIVYFLVIFCTSSLSMVKYLKLLTEIC